MARTSFTFDEMVYNTIVNGKQIYYGDDVKTIDYVKITKDTRQMEVHCVGGDVFLANQDDEFDFEVTTPKDRSQPNKPKLKGNK